MKKWIAILFMMLLCSVTLVPNAQLPADMVEQLADTDKGKESKPEKKEAKEFLILYSNRTLAIPLSMHHYTLVADGWLPGPLLRKPTPPPDVIC